MSSSLTASAFGPVAQRQEQLPYKQRIGGSSPPGITYGIVMPSRSSSEWTPACHAGDRGFKSHRGRSARYANRQSGEAQIFVILRVRLPPLPLEIRVGWALACPSGCNPPASAVQVRFLPDALKIFGPFVYRFRTPASHAGKAGSIPARVTFENRTKW